MSVSTGRCLCGQITFEIKGDAKQVIACHCDQCRQTSGHYWAGVTVSHDDFHLTKDDGLKWFQSTELARKGFCTGCGASIFWEQVGMSRVTVAAGCLDNPTGTELARHIFVSEKGSYYPITDGLPQALQFDLDAD